jgi:hypothetical protein
MTLLSLDTDEEAPRPLPAMRRYDLYANSHRALRLFLTDTLGKLGSVDVSDASALNTTLRQLRLVLLACRAHIDMENRFVHAAVEAHFPGRSGVLALAHVEHLAELSSLLADTEALQSTPETPRAMRLYKSFALFVADKLHHMHGEEIANNEALCNVYDDDEIRFLELRMVRGLDRRDAETLLRWMIAALPPSALSDWFQRLKSSTVPSEFTKLLEALRSELDGPGWSKLQHALGRAENTAPDRT